MTLPKEDNITWPEDHMFDTYKSNVKYVFTAEMLKSMLGVPYRIHSASWDQDKEIFTVFCTAPVIPYATAEGQEARVGSISDIKPFGLDQEDIFEAQLKKREEEHIDIP